MLSNGKSFFRISDEKHFEEIQIFGSRKIMHSITAEQYPEMLRIRDMIDGSEGIYEELDESRWNELLKSMEG